MVSDKGNETPGDNSGPVSAGRDGVRSFATDALPGWAFHDLGPALNEQFAALAGWCAAGTPFDPAGFRAAAYAYLDSPSVATPGSDPFFDNLGVIGKPFAERPLRCTGIWEWALSVVHDWEASRAQRVHKGTGYYFAGMRDVALGDLDRGFLYMHQAAVEDRISSGLDLPATPAAWFITLDASRMDQAYRDKVAEYEAYLVRQLDDYRSTSRGALTLEDLRDRVARHPELLDGLLTTAHVIARLTRHEDPRTARIRDNGFARLLLSQVALELCLVVEDVLLRANARDPTFVGKRPLMFWALVKWFAPKAHMTLTNDQLKLLPERFRVDFEGVMIGALEGSSIAEIGRPLTDPEADILVSYGMRNHAAHGLERSPTATVEFDRVIPHLFFALFNAIETLFP